MKEMPTASELTTSQHFHLVLPLLGRREPHRLGLID